MKRITVKGGHSLVGDVAVSGSKNAALPIIFSCILINGVSEIKNLPDIGDVRVALEILEDFGAKIDRCDNLTKIDTRRLSYKRPDERLVSSIRASTYLLGSCLARFGVSDIMQFGGCSFSSRPIDMHLDACAALGARIEGDRLLTDRLVGAQVNFDKRSVGATVNAILLAVSAKGNTVITGGAREPHIDALIDFLISCSAEITRIGDELHIDGRELHGGSITVIGDMIEAGSYLALGLMTGGRISVNNCPVSDMDAVFSAFTDLGADVILGKDRAECVLKEQGKPLNIVTNPYPGFPTDLQPIFAPLMASLSGGEITDTVWQGRFGYLRSLADFGVNSIVSANHARILKSHIHRGVSKAPDLRGGFACLASALLAQGRSEIYSAEIILRGYESLADKLCALGADIKIDDI